MKTYRITKYNPSKRNKEGNYLDNSEWTSIHDIGKPENNHLTFEEYERVESAYVNAVRLIMDENRVESLIVDSLENHNSDKDLLEYELQGILQNISKSDINEIWQLNEGTRVNKKLIENVIRLILRETIWMLLKETRFKVRIGYDYYMYVTCSNLSRHTIKEMESTGLYVEADTNQSEITLINGTVT